MTLNPNLVIKTSTDRGRGVFAKSKISEGEVIEVCPIIICDAKDLDLVHKTRLHDYYFLWGEAQDRPAIALGYGSLYNHNQPANADFVLDYTNDTIEFFALQDIEPNTEITIDYHAGIEGESKLWF